MTLEESSGSLEVHMQPLQKMQEFPGKVIIACTYKEKLEKLE